MNAAHELKETLITANPLLRHIPDEHLMSIGGPDRMAKIVQLEPGRFTLTGEQTMCLLAAIGAWAMLQMRQEMAARGGIVL